MSRFSIPQVEVASAEVATATPAAVPVASFPPQLSSTVVREVATMSIDARGVLRFHSDQPAPDPDACIVQLHRDPVLNETSSAGRTYLGVRDVALSMAPHYLSFRDLRNNAWVSATEERREELRARLLHLGGLQAGWLDGEGMAPSRLALRIAGRVLDQLVWRFGRPQVFPTPDGAVLAEWERANAELSAEFRADGGLEISAWRVGSDTTIERRIDAKEEPEKAAILIEALLRTFE